MHHNYNSSTKMRLMAMGAAAMLTLAAVAQNVTYYTTKANGSQRLQKSTASTTTFSNSSNVITMLPSQQNQSIDGFGFAITYSSCYNLLKMSKADRTNLLRRTYSTTSGYGVSYARISIGCNDFSSTEYSLCDQQGLENFRLHSDETNYVIPILKEILAINPNVKIIATPWTCPQWMKVESLTDLRTKWSWTDGHLNPNYRQTYAEYFVKFINTMKTYGINIYAVCPQNEPLNRYNCASLYMPWQEEAEFLKYLAPAIKNAGLSTKIYVFDHNYNYDNVSDQNDYPIKIYNALSGQSFAGSELIVGAAYHNYGGWYDELEDIHNQAPDKELIFSEESIGTWNNGRDLNGTLIDKMKNVVLATVNRWCRTVLVWNFMLDDHMGPNLDGGCQTCYGAIDINSSDYKTLTYNSHYYVISHMSTVVQPGAVRISTSGWWANNMDYSAFRNPDGSYAMVFASSNSADQNFVITDGSQYASVTVPANSIVSVLMGKETTQQNIYFNGQRMEQAADNAEAYTLATTLTKGQKYTASGSDAFTMDSFYTDPDFFEKNSDGSFTFLGATGSYTVKADLTYNCFRVWAMNGNTPATLNSDGTGAVWCIGSAGINKPSWAVVNTGWNEGTDYDMCLAQVADKVYQLTLTVGEQLSKDDVNFKFFGQAGWGTEFLGTNATYHLSTSSDIFGIGTGTDGHDNGNIYLKDGQTLNNGETYIFTIDLTQGTSNGVMSVEKIVSVDYDGIYLIGANSSIGADHYVDSDPVDWGWDPDRAIAMTKVDNTHYSIDLTVGQQLNKDVVNFKFFGQPGWGLEFNTTGNYKITSNSDLFAIGNGTGGHDDGNVYLKEGQSLQDGTVYRFTIDLTDPYNVVLSTEANPTAIQAVRVADSKDADCCYTLQGVRVGKPVQRGVYIRGGKKVIIR